MPGDYFERHPERSEGCRSCRDIRTAANSVFNVQPQIIISNKTLPRNGCEYCTIKCRDSSIFLLHDEKNLAGGLWDHVSGWNQKPGNSLGWRKGEEDHAHGERMAVNAAPRLKVLKLIRGAWRILL
jgi:MinD superfamily P-loop ATPase